MDFLVLKSSQSSVYIRSYNASDQGLLVSSEGARQCLHRTFVVEGRETAREVLLVQCSITV
jgi:hypothetical protein